MIMNVKAKNYGKALIAILLCMAIFFPNLSVTVLAGNRFSTADTLVLNASYSDVLLTKDNINYYRFTTSSNDSFYKVELRNTEATDIIGLTLYYEDDITTGIYNFVATKATANYDIRKLEPNHTYYIAVKNPYPAVGSPTGAYKLSVTEIKDDVGDNFSKSTTITLNKKVAYNLNVDGDCDYFKFKTSKNNSYYKIELANSEVTGPVRLVLYSAADSTTSIYELSADKANISSKIIKLAKNRTYYMLVTKTYGYDNPTGIYKVKVTEIKDDAPETFDNSVNITLNKKSTYKLNVDGDVDYFKFTTTNQGNYTITLANTSGNDSISAQIYSDEDVTQKIGAITAHVAAKNSTTLYLKANHTYYISVAKSNSYYSVTGEYAITITK